MTQRDTYPESYNANPEVTRLSGIFRPQNTGTPVAESGRGVTVTRTGTGQFTLTVDFSFVAFLSYNFTLSMAAATDAYLQVSTKSATAKTIVVTNYTGGGTTAADIATNANNAISWQLEVTRSGQSVT